MIGSLSMGTLYKGTLSSGVEIAVTSSVVTSSKDWSKNLEAQFRAKVLTDYVQLTLWLGFILVVLTCSLVVLSDQYVV